MTKHPLAWQAPSADYKTDFATTHCLVCQAGWTRTGKEGQRITVCLLDREQVIPDMTGCDRFKHKDEPDL
jgi:hypothetical protein